MTAIDLGRPVSGDVVELILEDHRRFETLLRDLRDSSSDRDAVRDAFATLHVAHAEAEEKYVYPKLRRKDAITEHEADHGEELTILNPTREEVGGRAARPVPTGAAACAAADEALAPACGRCGACWTR
jgi:hypothetical protein